MNRTQQMQEALIEFFEKINEDDIVEEIKLELAGNVACFDFNESEFNWHKFKDKQDYLDLLDFAQETISDKNNRVRIILASNVRNYLIWIPQLKEEDIDLYFQFTSDCLSNLSQYSEELLAFREQFYN